MVTPRAAREDDFEVGQLATLENFATEALDDIAPASERPPSFARDEWLRRLIASALQPLARRPEVYAVGTVLTASSGRPPRTYVLVDGHHFERLEDAWLRDFPASRVLQRSVGSDRSPVGKLQVVLHADTDLSDSTQLAIDHVLAVLAIGLRLVRTRAERLALVQMSKTLADNASDPLQSLQRLAAIVHTQLESDGVKVYYVRRQGARQIMLQIYRSDRPHAPRKAIEVSSQLGLSDWVVLNDDWLLIENCVPADQTAALPEEGATGRHGRVAVLARREQEYIPDESVEDDERTILLVPLHARRQLVGVLAVWRKIDQPYDVEHDPRVLLQLAPHVVSGCIRLLQRERSREELESISKLAAMLDPRHTIPVVKGAVLERLALHAEAPAVVLLRHDPKLDGHYYFCAIWPSSPQVAGGIGAALRDIHLVVEPSEVTSRIRSEIDRRLASAGIHDYACDRELIYLPAANPSIAVAAPLRLRSESLEPWGDPLGRRHSSPAFIRYATDLLAQHGQARAVQVVDRLDDPMEGAGADPLAILRRAAELLRESTQADCALVYERDGEELRLAHVVSQLDAPELSRRLTRDSLVWASAEAGACIRILDARDDNDPRGQHIDRAFLQRVIGTESGNFVRSWLCCPVVHHNRVHGAIELVTGCRGPYLGPEDEELAGEMGRRAAWEIRKIARQFMLENLNTLAIELANAGDEALAEQLVPQVEGWLSRHVRANCQVAVFARSASGSDLVAVHSVAMDAHLAAELRQRSREQTQNVWNGHMTFANATLHVLCVSLSSPAERLAGHLIVAHPEPYGSDDESAVRELARELAIVLNGERLRHEWMLANGLFRHALLGPVQGLTSTARMLGEFAAVSVPEERLLPTLPPALARSARNWKPEVQRLRDRIDEEAEVVRLWRKNNKLFMLRDVELKPRKQALMPVLERCAARYRGPLQARGMALALDTRFRGQLDFVFDDYALDLALSNLLDNARKYGFFHRQVTLGAEVSGEVVRVWVEDIGNPIPDEWSKRIYDTGVRSNRADPLRVIRGEGLGLALASTLAVKHGGRIFHVCEKIGHEDGPTVPYRVRFTIELPHGWRRRRS